MDPGHPPTAPPRPQEPSRVFLLRPETRDYGSSPSCLSPRIYLRSGPDSKGQGSALLAFMGLHGFHGPLSLFLRIPRFLGFPTFLLPWLFAWSQSSAFPSLGPWHIALQTRGVPGLRDPAKIPPTVPLWERRLRWQGDVLTHFSHPSLSSTPSPLGLSLPICQGAGNEPPSPSCRIKTRTSWVCKRAHHPLAPAVPHLSKRPSPWMQRRYRAPLPRPQPRGCPVHSGWGGSREFTFLTSFQVMLMSWSRDCSKSHSS